LCPKQIAKRIAANDCFPPFAMKQGDQLDRQTAVIQIRIAFLNCGSRLGAADIILIPQNGRETPGSGFTRPFRSTTRTACWSVRTCRERRN
jgi:hypothetical protein